MTELRVFTTSIMGSIPTAMYWILLAVFCVGLFLFVWRKGLREGLRASTVLLLVEWVVLVLSIAVILREPRAERSFSFIPFSSYFDYGTNSYFMEKAALNILNVVLFVPVGVILGFMVHGSWFTVNERRWLWVMMVGCGLSVLIELLQLIFKRGLCEVDDVIHNVLGCMIGYGIATLTLTLTKKSH